MGLRVGFNYQSGNIVFGFQADVIFGIDRDYKRGPYLSRPPGDGSGN